MPSPYSHFPQLSLRCHFPLICPNYDAVQNHAMHLIAMLLKSLLTQRSSFGQDADLLKIPDQFHFLDLCDHSLLPWYFCKLEIRSEDSVRSKLHIFMKRTSEVVPFISVITHQEIHAYVMIPPLMRLRWTLGYSNGSSILPL